MNIKAITGDFLRHHPVLFKLASKVYYGLNKQFKTLSEGTPEAILKAFEMAKTNKSSSIGDYYEFGIFRGYSFLKAYEYSQKLGIQDINFYGFDSFKGLPETQEIDMANGRFFEGQFACSRRNVEKNLIINGMDMLKTVLIEGFYKDSLTEKLRQQYNFKPASVILIDCDLYSSTTNALEWVDKYLQDGTILLFDDWFSFEDKQELGQQRSLHEFLENHPSYNVEHLWTFSKHGNALLLRIRSQ